VGELAPSELAAFAVLCALRLRGVEEVSAGQLAPLLLRSASYAEKLLRSLEAKGVAERAAPGRWRLREGWERLWMELLEEAERNV
jgi:predicted outer membrane lipoprotein